MKTYYVHGLHGEWYVTGRTLAQARLNARAMVGSDKFLIWEVR